MYQPTLAALSVGSPTAHLWGLRLHHDTFNVPVQVQEAARGARDRVGHRLRRCQGVHCRDLPVEYAVVVVPACTQSQEGVQNRHINN